MTTMIGGEVCKQRLGSRLLPAEPRELTRTEIDRLWRIFVAIGTTWENTVHDSAGLKSSWLEFVNEKTTIRPSYVAEYVNALEVVKELVECHGDDAFVKLFFESGIPPSGTRERAGYAISDVGGLPEVTWRPTFEHPEEKATGPLDTRLAHAKCFVVDQFIRVQILAGGFKNFVRPERIDSDGFLLDGVANYNGFIAASRYNRLAPVRQPKGQEQ